MLQLAGVLILVGLLLTWLVLLSAGLSVLFFADARSVVDSATIIEGGLDAEHPSITAPARLAIDEYLQTMRPQAAMSQSLHLRLSRR